MRLNVCRWCQPSGFKAPRIIQKKLTKALFVDGRRAGAAIIELMKHAPGHAALAIGLLPCQAHMRIAQAVPAQVLSGTRQQHHFFLPLALSDASFFCGQRQTAFNHLWSRFSGFTRPSCLRGVYEQHAAYQQRSKVFDQLLHDDFLSDGSD